MPSTSLETMVLKLSATRTHRVWVVDALDTLRVVGVVTLTDLMLLLDLRVYIQNEDSN
jgi:CBS domain-containing protein